MTDVTELESVYIDHLLGFSSDADVIKRAEGLLASSSLEDPIADLGELASLPVGSPKQAERAGDLLGVA